MQRELAKFFFILLFFLALAIVWFSGALTPRLPDPLLENQREINRLAEETHRSGQKSTVSFFASEAGAVVVLLPPYAVVADIEGLSLNPVVKDEMQRDVNAVEMGHLYYISQGRIKDRKLLSTLIEPVPGFSTRREMDFVITDQQAAGRPVTVRLEPR